MKNVKNIEETLYKILGISLLDKIITKVRNTGNIIHQLNNEKDLKSHKKNFIKNAILWSIPVLLMMLSAPAPIAAIATFKTIATGIGLSGIILQRYRWLKMKREFELHQKQRKQKEEMEYLKQEELKKEKPVTNEKALELKKESKPAQSERKPEKKVNSSHGDVLKDLKDLREEFRASMGLNMPADDSENFPRTRTNGRS